MIYIYIYINEGSWSGRYECYWSTIVTSLCSSIYLYKQTHIFIYAVCYRSIAPLPPTALSFSRASSASDALARVKAASREVSALRRFSRIVEISVWSNSSRCVNSREIALDRSSPAAWRAYNSGAWAMDVEKAIVTPTCERRNDK